MKLFTLVGVVLLAVATQAQQQQRGGNFVDYDYQDTIPSQQPARSSPPPRPRPSILAPTLPKPTPVPILKQINRHNDDGSYTYGYEGADGSFKIETKLPTGEVMGKYGYVDDAGKLRVVDYGANKYGFQPAGEGITVAPPTLVDETKILKKGPNGEEYYEYDDGTYQEPQQAPIRTDARVAKKPSRPAPRPVATPSPIQYSFQDYDAPQPYVAPRPRPAPVQSRPSPGPVPQRAQITGASPIGPPPQAYRPPPQAYRPPPQAYRAPQTFAPAPRPAVFRDAAPVREAPAAKPNVGLLDKLADQYALPRGSGQPLHDISFGSYSTSY